LLRLYTPADCDACLAIFDSNTPRFFAPRERPPFAEWLLAPLGRFYVLCDDAGAVVGCGGVVVKPGTTVAYLSWGMVHGSRHGQGLGRELTLERLRVIAAMPEVTAASLDTSQKTVGFYEKLGFKRVTHLPNHYGPGLDRYDLWADVDGAFRARFNPSAGGPPTPPAARPA